MSRFSTQWFARGLAAVVLALLCVGVPPAPSTAAAWSNSRGAFASPRFEQVWRSADAAVLQQRSDRSWTWGPSPWFDYKEYYNQAAFGLRQVQYFDKARMEINNPSDTSGPLGGVTNGLLVVEMVSGRVKLGEGIGPDQYEQRAPAFELPVVGDLAGRLGETPGYASFSQIATTDNGYRDPRKVGQRVGATLSYNTVGYRQELANMAGTEIVAYEQVTGHNIPRVFDDFLRSGPITAIYTFGYPITDAYWVRARVNGQDRDVLVQLFERRTLSYTPSNPRQFQVEMGNVGQHYFQWRYPHLGMAWAADAPELPITFASMRGSRELNVYRVDVGATKYGPYVGMDERPLTGGDVEAVPFSWQRSYDPAKVRLFGDTKRFNGKRQIFSMRPDGSDFRRVLESDANDYNPQVSPDGTKLAFVSDRDGSPNLYIMNLQGDIARFTSAQGCIFQYPAWLPDGSGLIYESNCLAGPDFEIWSVELSYTEDKLGLLRVMAPRKPIALTNNHSDDRYPRVSSEGLTAFTASRDGNPEIYTMRPDGSEQTRVTQHPAVDEAPAWSRNGLVWASNREGDYSIFIRQTFPEAADRRLTAAGPDDRWPVGDK